MRVLCLGNSVLADDAFGLVVAEELRRARPDLDVRESSTSGFDLLEYTLGADRLIVVDTVQSGVVPPGTVSTFREGDVRSVPGGSHTILVCLKPFNSAGRSTSMSRTMSPLSLSNLPIA